MPALDPQVAMHHFNINPDMKPVKKTAMTAPLRDNGSDSVRSQKVYRLQFHQERTTP